MGIAESPCDVPYANGTSKANPDSASEGNADIAKASAFRIYEYTPFGCRASQATSA